MSNYPPPSMPYVESRFQGGKQKPTAIILQGTFTTSEEGAALGLAQAWHTAQSPLRSGHYTVDERKRFRCTPDRVVSGNEMYHNKGAIRIAICAQPVSREVFWDYEDEHRPVLNKTAELVAELTLAYNIGVTYLPDLERWSRWRSRARGGLYVENSEGWPYQQFINEVKAQRSLKTHI